MGGLELIKAEKQLAEKRVLRRSRDERSKNNNAKIKLSKNLKRDKMKKNFMNKMNILMKNWIGEMMQIRRIVKQSLKKKKMKKISDLDPITLLMQMRHLKMKNKKKKNKRRRMMKKRKKEKKRKMEKQSTEIETLMKRVRIQVTMNRFQSHNENL